MLQFKFDFRLKFANLVQFSISFVPDRAKETKEIENQPGLNRASDILHGSKVAKFTKTPKIPQNSVSNMCLYNIFETYSAIGAAINFTCNKIANLS